MEEKPFPRWPNQAGKIVLYTAAGQCSWCLPLNKTLQSSCMEQVSFSSLKMHEYI